jgi:hypothetical protein
VTAPLLRRAHELLLRAANIERHEAATATGIKVTPPRLCKILQALDAVGQAMGMTTGEGE